MEVSSSCSNVILPTGVTSSTPQKCGGFFQISFQWVLGNISPIENCILQVPQAVACRTKPSLSHIVPTLSQHRYTCAWVVLDLNLFERHKPSCSWVSASLSGSNSEVCHWTCRVLHNGCGHWLTVPTVGANCAEVFVFDSLYPSTGSSVKMQISCLLHTHAMA